MRRIVITLLLGLVPVAAAVGQQKRTDLEHGGLKGKIKTVKVEEARLSNKSGTPVEGKKVQLETTTYGENGMLVRSVRVDAGARGDYFYSYDANGNRLELIRNAVTQSRVKTEFKYDANGNRVEEIQTGDEGLVAKSTYVYDSKGRCTEKRLFNKQGMFARRTYAYKTGDNPTEEAEYDPKGGLVGKQSYSYELDSTGNWTKRITSRDMVNNGKQFSEPTEVTYRTITYF